VDHRASVGAMQFLPEVGERFRKAMSRL